MTKNKKPLTDRQYDYYEAILYFWRAKGTSPTYDEISQRVGGVSRHAVHETLRALIRKGWIKSSARPTARTTVPVNLKIQHQQDGHIVFWEETNGETDESRNDCAAGATENKEYSAAPACST